MDYQEIFNDSYDRVLGEGVKDSATFFQRFYEIFTSKSPLVAEKFAHTDMIHQIEMMRRSLSYVVNFYGTCQGSRYVVNLARLHGQNDFDITSELYDLWLDALVDTVKERCPGFDSDTELAWRIVMAPGIAFMRYHYDKL